MIYAAPPQMVFSSISLIYAIIAHLSYELMQKDKSGQEPAAWQG